ncbi:MAG: redoxin domain-containing protein [Acidobacteria bacterium]|nr:redoxin domain-containing protein [Acidobacteriota bacterium]
MGALLNLWLVAALIGAAAQIKSTEGVMLRPLEPSGAANVLLFVATDCPIANGYAPEIQRMCKAYAPSGVRCQLIYEDVGVAAEAVRKHLAEYRYSGATAAIDGDAAIARRVNATVTPEAVVVDHAGTVRYRGRIDNQYETLGRPRRVVTAHDLQDALDAVIAGKPVSTPETEPVGCYIVSPEMRRK